MAERRGQVLAAGLLWGTYHFIRQGGIAQQVEWYLAYAQPKSGDLMALDWEDNRVSVDAAEEWLVGVAKAVGRRPIIYSGNTAKELLGSRADSFFGGHRLWLAQYSSRPVVQRSWQEPWLWQYSGDGLGPAPHAVDGISIPGHPGIDMNHYPGDRVALQKEWVADAVGVPQTPHSPSTGAKWVQESLNLLGAEPPLVVDGVYGPRTRQAVLVFQTRERLDIDGVVGAQTVKALDDARKRAGIDP
jgi:hypothetical protein